MTIVHFIRNLISYRKASFFPALVPLYFIPDVFFFRDQGIIALYHTNLFTGNKLFTGIAAGIVILILLMFFLLTTRIRNRIKENEKEIEKKGRIIEEQKKEILSQKEKLLEKKNLAEEQNKLIRKQTIELEKHRHHLEKLVESRTNDLKIAKEKAEESDQLKTSFLENMSHEIRTPMNAIMGFASLLNDNNLPQEDIKNYTTRINRNCQVLLNLIDNILDMSKIHAGQMEIVKSNFSVKNLLEELLEHFTIEKEELGKKNIKLIVKIEPKDKDYILYSDPLRFKQIMQALVGNAFKYTEKGSIKFGCIPHYITEYEKEPKMLEFFVEDTGIGIPPDKSDFIFDRFSKLEDKNSKLYRGAGLGLYIVKHLVRLMNGKIWVHSHLSKGSTFHFTLPYFDTSDVKTKKKEAARSRKKTLPAYDWRNKTILIVEDEQNNFIYLSEIIKRTGAKLLEAGNGEQSCELVRKHPQIDLVLMDIMMPGMNGYEATKKIKSLRPGLPVIAQTAYSKAKEKERSLEAGCDGYISKPYNPPVLLDLINNFI